jgi:NAD(P)-dependent dehydrogenase (short-subunit alcohol dehydrogenase family)
MSDSVALVTGGTSGIGRETVVGLARRDWTVLVHGRDAERGRQVCETVRNETDGTASFFEADLADFDAVRDLAEAVADECDRLDVLLNNAGTWQGDRALVDATGERASGSRAGVELTMAVNHCAHYLLTRELWALLSAVEGRVITVSSDLHRRGRLDTDRFVGPEGPTGQQAYADSKLANVAFTRALARRGESVGVTAACCHPGVVPSSRLARDSGGLSQLGWKLFGMVGGLVPFGPIDSERDAAATSLFLATADDIESGGYYSNERPKGAKTTDKAAEAYFWEWTGDVVGVDAAWPPVETVSNA